METLDTTRQGSYAGGFINSFLNQEYDEAVQERYEPLKTIEEQAAFYKLSRLATEYAHIFYSQLAIEEIQPAYMPYLLPLVFVPEEEAKLIALAKDRKAETFDAGSVAENPFGLTSQFIITIALPKADTLTEDIKTAIRHELIHYYLKTQMLPHEDDSALFWAYCYIYDGHAYTPITSGEEKYSSFVQEADTADAPFYALHSLAEAIILDDESARERYENAKADPQAFLDHIQRIMELSESMK